MRGREREVERDTNPHRTKTGSGYYVRFLCKSMTLTRPVRIYGFVIEFSTYKSPEISPPPVSTNPSFNPLSNSTNADKDLSISTVVALVVPVPAEVV